MATEDECERVLKLLEDQLRDKQVNLSVVVDAQNGDFMIWVMSFEGEIDWTGKLPNDWFSTGWFVAEAAGATLCTLVSHPRMEAQNG